MLCDGLYIEFTFKIPCRLFISEVDINLLKLSANLALILAPGSQNIIEH